MKNLRNQYDIEMLQFELLGSFCNISHFITTRNGGDAADPYASFNLCDYTGDHPDHVALCRRQMADILNLIPADFLFPRQVHGDGILVATSSQSFSEDGMADSGEYDAVITATPGVCLGISTADCVPVLLYDPHKRVIAAVHAGWRGTVQHIVSKTVRRMSSEFGCLPCEIIAGIGPSISPAVFEVGEEVTDAFRQAGFNEVCSTSEIPGKGYVDLWEANKQDLLVSGVLPDHIEVAGLCTYSHSDKFFSARRLGIKSGRIVSGIVLR
ncbi:MAG: peptidoglycan editing factor PgeF [Bacteroidales bacterium]